MKKVLLIDDQLDIWEAVMRSELLQFGYELIGVADPQLALQEIKRSKPDIVLLDILFPGGNLGKPTLEKIKKTFPDLPVIMITSTMDKSEYHSEDYAQADYRYSKMALGDGEFSDLAQILDQFILKAKNNAESSLEGCADEGLSQYGFIVGQNSAMLQVVDMIDKVADQDVTILITGESGTGKELVAHALHSLGKRKEKPFSGIVCAALPSDLLESELFGHEKGSFTGAVTQKIGKFEVVEDGTIFLDEIGEIPSETQVKLLRFLQEKEFQRVGGNDVIPFRGRVITATNRDLKKQVESREFREDLYFRLKVISIQLPPLRERLSDIPSFFRFFVTKANGLTGKRVLPILRDNVLQLLSTYSWPGNIRELENCIQRAVSLADENILQPKNFDLPESAKVSTEDLVDLHVTVEKIFARQLDWNKLKLEFGAGGSLRRELLILLIKSIQNRFHSKPTAKDLGETLGVSHGNMRRILSECGISLNEF